MREILHLGKAHKARKLVRVKQGESSVKWPWKRLVKATIIPKAS
jgi:hypothetical protein